MRLSAAVGVLLLLAAAYAARGRLFPGEVRMLSRNGASMNTAIRISVMGEGKKPEKVLDESFLLLDSLNGQLSLFQKDSAVARINDAAGAEPETVSPDVFAVIEDARFRLPDPASVDELLPLTKIENLEMLSPDRVRLRQKGCMLDLGGIAKGYASLRLANLFRARGVRSSLIDLGGNIYAVGSQPDGTPWNIGIRNPRDTRGAPIAVLSVADAAVVTSGAYERFKIIDGVRYSHFFDPSTGYPVRNAMLSATLVTPDGTLADALATAFMVMGADRASRFLEDRPELGAILILEEDEGVKILATRNLEGRLRTTDPSLSVHFF